MERLRSPQVHLEWDGAVRLLVTVYGLILVGELMWSAMVPLVPVFAHSLDLSTFEMGVLVSGTGAAVLVVSLPAGVLADRVGARRVAVAASFFLSLRLAGHALPSSFWSLLMSRVVFGVGFGGLWTAGSPWRVTWPRIGCEPGRSRFQ